MWVGSLGQKDPLEGEMATHSCILAWKIPWIEEPSGYIQWGTNWLDTSEHACTHFPSSIWDTFQSGGLISQCHIFLPFHTVHGVPAARMLEGVAISSSSGTHFVRACHYDPFVLGGPV